jgi:serine/threonine protein phosphatase 1
MFGVLQKTFTGLRSHQPIGHLHRETPGRDCAIPPGQVVYAIGDIHGRVDLLDRLVEVIWRDAETLEINAASKPELILLGDYIDRGPSSKQVINYILALCETQKFKVVPLMGNHERTMLDFLADPQIGPTWLEHGGGPTLNAYGVAPPRGKAEGEWSKAAAALSDNMPERHLAFFKGLHRYHEVGDYVFVHAGIRPGVPIDAQTDADLLWIRDEFLRSRAWLGKMVVHGHTPTVTPAFKSNRIGLDTGAYATNLLTALRLKDNTQTILQAR